MKNLLSLAVSLALLPAAASAGQLFHTKGRGNGYILTLGGKRVYFAGDTECVIDVRILNWYPPAR